MPSPISFPPVDCPPATPGGAAQSNNDASQNAPDAFDRALTQAAPPSPKATARTSVTGNARPSAEKTKSADSSEKSSDKKEATGRAPLSPEELAALLALIGAPAAQQSPPPPVVPADFNLDVETNPSASGSADADLACGANFSASAPTTGKDAALFIPRAPGAQNSTTPTFTLPTDKKTAGAPSARELLAQGADVIDYDLASTASAPAQPTPAPNAPVMPVASLSATNPTDAALAATSVPADTDATRNTNATAEVAAQMSPSTDSADTAVDADRLAGKKASPKGASEKIAARGFSRVVSDASRVISSNGSKENNFLNVDDKQLASESSSVGTRAANWGDSMSTEARSTPFAQRLSDGAAAAVGATPVGTSASGRASETAATKTASAPQAAQIVSEIRDIADGLWAVERNSVEVRFHFSEHERLSVKVEYKDGVVQTTFRTDSPTLRDTIAREWQSQVTFATESRPYRVADPVFNAPPVDARGFSLGGDSSRQQRQAEQSSGTPHTFATTSGRGPSSSSVAAAPATSFIRPDTALHLHAFA